MSGTLDCQSIDTSQDVITSSSNNLNLIDASIVCQIDSTQLTDTTVLQELSDLNFSSHSQPHQVQIAPPSDSSPVKKLPRMQLFSDVDGKYIVMDV